eukprot:scaffold194555_cov51-Attheya_sp.AAC.1
MSSLTQPPPLQLTSLIDTMIHCLWDQMIFYETAPPNSGVKKNTKPPVVHKLRGTTRSKNETVAHLSRQRADRDHQRLHLEFRTPAKPVERHCKINTTEHISSSPLVESDNLPRNLVGDLDGYEEPVGTNFGKLKHHWEGVMK